jgi:hypothetical protein
MDGFVCVKTNVKKPVGRLCRPHRELGLHQRKAVNLIARHPYCNCQQINYHPLPELEAL